MTNGFVTIYLLGEKVRVGSRLMLQKKHAKEMLSISPVINLKHMTSVGSINLGQTLNSILLRDSSKVK